MRKEVTLGMTIGGALLVVAAVVVSISHKDHSTKKTTGQVILAGESSGAGDVAGPGTDETQPSSVKADEKPTVKPPETETPGHKAVELAIAPAKKDDITSILFSGGKGEPPLISTEPVAIPGQKSTDHTITQTPPTTEAPTVLPPSTQPAGKARTHTVQKGETFSTIAAVAYGSANYYPYIMRANPKVEANRLKPGMILTLPDASEVIPAEKSGDVKPEVIEASHKTVAAIDSSKEYRVVAGDSLNKIALTLYGKIAMVDKLYEANKATIGDNPAALKIGMVLKLPQAPAATTH